MRILFFIIGLIISFSSYAVCPICTFAVGAGIGLTQWLGIDDSVTGVWIGGLTVSCILWTISWFEKKNITFPLRNLITWVAYYLLMVVPLFYTNLIGHALNKLWGIDKILLGIIIGSIFFYCGAVSYAYLKKHHNDKAYFPFQKVVMPVAPLIVISFIFYFITK